MEYLIQTVFQLPMLAGIGTTIAAAVILWLNIERIRKLRLENHELKVKLKSREDDRSKKIGSQSNEAYFLANQIKLSQIFLKQVDGSNKTIAELRSSISSEFRNHPNFLNFEYISMPIPLRGGVNIIATRQDGIVTIDSLVEKFTNAELHDAWIDLTEKYHEAARLHFRNNHESLVLRRNRNTSLRVVKKLFESSSSYFAISYNISSDDRATRLHELKNLVVVSLLKAEEIDIELEGGDKIINVEIGQLALQLERAISSVHKMILEYGDV